MIENNLKTPSQLIKQHLIFNSITVISVAESLNISRHHLGEVLNGNRGLSEPLRTKLNAYLETDF